MIRKIEYKDLEAVNEIYNQAVAAKFQTADTEPVSMEERIKWFNEHNLVTYPVFVFEKEDKVIGWISLSSYRNGRKSLKYTAEVSYYIHKDWRRKGLGTMMMEHAIEEAKNYGFKTLFAILLEPNVGSIKLLEKFNYKLWGTLPAVADFDGLECDHLYYGLRIQ